jgi:hypothetical protein
MKKNINEQQSQNSLQMDDEEILKSGFAAGCITPKTKEKEFKFGAFPSKPNVKVYFGENSEKQTIVYYGNGEIRNLSEPNRVEYWYGGPDNKECKGLTKTAGVEQKTTSLTPDQQTKIEVMVNDQAWSKTKYADYDTYPGKYETFTEVPGIILYRRSDLKNTRPDQITSIENDLKSKNFTLKQPQYGTPEWDEWSKNNTTLKNYPGTTITPENAKVLGINDINIPVYPIKAGGQTFSADTQDCTTQLADYFTKALQSTATNERLMTDQQIETYKKNIRKCKGLGMYDNFKFDEKTLNPQVTKSLKPYGFLNRRLTYKEIVKNLSDKGVFQLPESKSNQIKNLIRENINEIKATKHKRLIQEENIIGKRLSIITEGVNVKSKEQQRKISKEMFNETIYLSTQGYDKELISENLFDIFSGLFPKGVAEPIMQYFKEEAAKWLAGKLGLDPNSWMSSIIISAIGDLNIGDVSKLTDCNFVTKWLSKSIAEGVVRKIQVEKFGDNAFYNLIRNTMVEALEVTKLGTMFEESLGKIICPLVSNLSGKMEGAADVMKQKALGSA